MATPQLKPVRVANLHAASKAVRARIDDVVAYKTANKAAEPTKINSSDLFGYSFAKDVPRAEQMAVTGAWAASTGPSNHDTSVAAEAMKNKAEAAAQLEGKPGYYSYTSSLSIEDAEALFK